MTRVTVRVVAPDQKSRDRAVRQLEAGGVLFSTMPLHPGRRGDWLAYGWLEADPAPGEPTRRTARRSDDPGRYVTDADMAEMRLEAARRAFLRRGPEYP
jgi:hypothetical protein